MPNIYRKPEAARALKISVETLDRYRKMGKLPYRQIGDRVIFTESDLATFLENCAVPATTFPTPRERVEVGKRAARGKHEDTA